MRHWDESGSEIIDVEGVHCIAETDKAVLIRDPYDCTQAWIPKSQCESWPKLEKNALKQYEGTLRCRRWVAVKGNLL